MTTSLEQSDQPFPAMRTGLVDELCTYFGTSGEPRADLLCDFTREFFAKVPRQLVAERSTRQLADLTRGAFDLLERSGTNAVTVEVTEPMDEGWSAPVTVIRAVLRDRPFIVDTIREYLGSLNLPIQHYVYPILAIRRDGTGRIAEVLPAAEGPPQAIVHCEIPQIPEVERRQEIRAEIERRLLDVVAATDDFEPMLEALDEVVKTVSGYGAANARHAEELAEIESFLRWLADGNFVFLGYREYETVSEGYTDILRVRPGSGLGILRDEDSSTWGRGVPLEEVPEELRRRVLEGPLLITSKTNAEATVHRRARMDYVGVKKLDSGGQVAGEFRFLGLFTSKAYAEHAEAIPILRRKLAAILAGSGAIPGSHDYKEIITIFNSMPKEDLFQASVEELEREVQTALGALFSDEVQVTLRRDPLKRGVAVTVILPRGKFSGEVRQRIQEVLRRRFTGAILNYHLAMGAGDQARLHFYVSSPPEVAQSVLPDQLAEEVRRIIRSWDDLLLEALRERMDAGEGAQLAQLYGSAFSQEYRAATLPEVAVHDIEQLETLRGTGQRVAITLREPRGRGRPEVFLGTTALKLYLVGERLILSDFMPILDNAGLRVVEVTPFVVSAPNLPEMMIYSFAVQGVDGGVIPADRAELLAEALLAIREGEVLNDPFNALVLAAGLSWREADLIRAYGYYSFQSGLTPTRFATARALTRHPGLASLIVDLFEARHHPDGPAATGLEEAAQRAAAIQSEIAAALDAVTSLAEDRAIRRIVSLVSATVRTNYFGGATTEPVRRSGGVPYTSIKIRSADVEELSRNGLLYEVFVMSARMEGVHLRGASVARGGIRWSDRPDDFRAEVLGLVQTQMVKNAVIVPGGSKGGFIVRRLPAERERLMTEVTEQYRTLIRGLLDVTDNLVGGAVVPPTRVIRWDGDDPYLVVAADKGTAHLSDVANEVAAEYGFWLGDAFASGGSQGYDHKKEGITARGAWECVRRHFRELGKDIQSEPFTVVGIGDMSGDVFGNGMLLSRCIRLVAAFDHRHVFIDPDPDPLRSHAERERLFRLERSSWEDYDRGYLSAGGMIVPRGSKEVELTPAAKAALGIPDSVTSLDGESLIRAVLRAPVELLWNGGIGTYVKDADETHAEIGDSGNDAVRVNAQELRCRVIGEGGNLGMTQRARIAFALAGGRLNTDALDNSGGVDLSDHEVNLKVLLAPLVDSGRIDMPRRNDLLEEVKPQVVGLVLRNNIRQSLAVSLDEARSAASLGDFSALITSFERERLLDRRGAGIPGADELEDRARDGLGLTRPTLCVLLAYAKLQAKRLVLEGSLPRDGATNRILADYFPAGAVEAAGPAALHEHPLRCEIVATQVVNDLVDLMGAAFLHRVSRDTGHPVDRAVTSWFIASEISDAPRIRTALEGLEGRVESAVIYRWYFGLARVLDRTTRWTLANVEAEVPIDRVVADLRSGLDVLRGEFGRLVTGEDRLIFEQLVGELREIGVEGAFAAELITLRFQPALLDILRISREASADAIDTARTYYAVAERLNIAWLQHALRAAAHDEHWEKRLVETLDADLHRAHRAITRKLIALGAENGAIPERIATYRQRRPAESGHLDRLLQELRSSETVPLAAFGVAVRALVGLAEA